MSSWNSNISGSFSSGPPPHHGAGMTPRPSPVCMAKGFSRNTPIIFRISFEACVARSGTSVGGAAAWFVPLGERPKLGDMDESSMMKQPSGSSGSTLTDSDGATETEAGGEVCLDSEHWVSTIASSVSCAWTCRSEY